MSKGPKLLFTLLLIALTWQAHAQVRDADSLYYRSYLKLSVLPIIFDVTVNKQFWLGLQYEFLLRRKMTIGASVDVLWTPEPDVGPPSFQNARQMSILVMPQLRYYTGKHTFKGYYLGISPLYMHSDYRYERANRYGVCFTNGYQFFIRRKFPVDINIWAGEIFEHYEYPYYGGETVSDSRAYFGGSLNICVGLPVGKRRK